MTLADLELRITEPFPQPPATVRQALAALSSPPERPNTGDQAADAAAWQRAQSDHAMLPRPWVPASCEPRLRRHVWEWLDKAASWINHEYPWTGDKMVPPCWIAHPHIAHELAVVACLRYSAEREARPDKLEEWHRHVLPLFLDRMRTRLAEGCKDGGHTDWPGRPQYLRYVDEDARGRRRRAFDHDTRRPSDIDDTKPPSWIDLDTGEIIGEDPDGLIPPTGY